MADEQPKRYRQLTDALAASECRNIVEIGVWNGHRARELLSAGLRRNRVLTYHGFDLFESLSDEELEAELSKRPPTRSQVAADLRRFQRRVALRTLLPPWRRRRFDFTLHQGYTRETLPAFRREHPGFAAEFVFIDGGHSVETIANDWDHCSQLVAENGTIFLDDFYGNPEITDRFGCNTLIERLRDDPGWRVSILPVVDSFERLGTVQIASVRPA